VTVHSSQFVQANSTFVAHGGSMVRCLCGVRAPKGESAYTVWTISPEALTLCVWNADDGTRQQQVKLLTPVTAIRQSGAHVWLGGTSEMYVFEAQSCQQVFSVKAHRGLINGVLPTSADTVWTAGNDNTLKVWQANGGQLVETLTGVDSRVLSLAQVGDTVWAGGFDKNLLVYNLNTRLPIEEVLTPHKDAVRSLAWIHGRSSSGVQTVCSGSRDGSIIVWEQQLRGSDGSDPRLDAGAPGGGGGASSLVAAALKQVGGRGGR
jgi:WD40 repeat protein